jgi:hypothetical protein
MSRIEKETAKAQSRKAGAKAIQLWLIRDSFAPSRLRVLFFPKACN